VSAEAIENPGGHFGSAASREHAAHLGMWVFLGTEVLLFASLFAAYGVYRMAYPQVFIEARHHMEIALGTINTVILVTASILVAMSIWAVRRQRRQLAYLLLVGSVLLGLGFLGVKGVEYARHVHEGSMPGAWYSLQTFKLPGAGMYFTLYFLLTGVHAIHVTIGVALLAVMALKVRSGQLSAAYHTPLELSGMYWHLVDMIWLFLWPMLYLA
jgi:cytochrome c oxidase subunit 3